MLLTVSTMLLVGLGGLPARATEPAATTPGAVALRPSGTTKVQHGTQVQGQSSPTAPAPTAAQRRYLTDADQGDDGPAGRVTKLPPTAPTGPGTAAPSGSAAATDLAFYRNSRLPAGGQRSGVGEPSEVTSGKDGFATGNWYAAYTHTSHAGTPSWSYLNPFSIFGAGFCCDQVVTYDAGHNRYYWLAQFNDHLVVANSGAGNLSSWCYYNWTPANFGLPAGASFDFNKMAVSTRFLYVATNVNGGSLVTRFPLEEQSTCSGFSASFYQRSTEFSPTFVQNTGDYMFWGTNWTSDLTLGSTFRVLRWGDADNSATVYDRSIGAFTFMFNGAGNCASADGVVLNWCQRTDSRMTGTGYMAAPAKGTGDSVVGWAFNAQQDANHPFPYIRRVYFRSSDLTYLGSSELWANWSAHLYPAMAVDYRGHVGMAFAWGGGTGTAHYYPGSAIMLDDDLAPAQPWAYSFYQGGGGNACLNTADNLRRWGDYLDIHPAYPAGYGFTASGFALTANAGACNTTASVAVANVVFGRTRDANAYARWK